IRAADRRPMRVRLPHQLDRAEVRRRLDERKGEIVTYFPEGMATLESGWQGEDHLDFTVAVAGQRIGGAIDIGDDHVEIEIDLPFILSFLRPTIERSMRKEGTRLLT
ncbi:MAG: polyhydroxyalkanoic acid system family protein, partial [Pseudomonadota bacterium]